ncbi:cyclin-dependent protein kinase inhibitor SMR13-like [Mangifera indica]|uniref:cyclin-dependent protein kinase inhibitor SMR13-like n=1 Tax=Mangifera indica TaxID=29780 RepID=UPI001CFAF60B|nr:cyclin-dependent protein kinase inhibitor SMR13-like [Mangifera indica]
MAPSERITRARARARLSASAAPKATRNTQNKKKLQQQIKELQKASDDFSKNINIDEDHHLDSSSGFSTPKAERYRIPEIVTCPPAPKKPRAVSNISSLQRAPIAFFAPPDLELFFYFAL